MPKVSPLLLLVPDTSFLPSMSGVVIAMAMQTCHDGILYATQTGKQCRIWRPWGVCGFYHRLREQEWEATGAGMKLAETPDLLLCCGPLHPVLSGHSDSHRTQIFGLTWWTIVVFFLVIYKISMRHGIIYYLFQTGRSMLVLLLCDQSEAEVCRCHTLASAQLGWTWQNRNQKQQQEPGSIPDGKARK